jgi:hypothetical protein
MRIPLLPESPPANHEPEIYPVEDLSRTTPFHGRFEIIQGVSPIGVTAGPKIPVGEKLSDPLVGSQVLGVQLAIPERDECSNFRRRVDISHLNGKIFLRDEVIQAEVLLVVEQEDLLEQNEYGSTNP